MFKDSCDAAWQGFPELKGTHWAVRPVEGAMALVARDSGMSLATIDDSRGRSRLRENDEGDMVLGLLAFTVGEVRVFGGLVYRRERLGGRLSDEWQFVEADSGLLVFKSGPSDGRDRRSIQVLGERAQAAVGSKFLRFTVEGPKPPNAVMSATDDSGRTILRFRLAYSTPDRPRPWRTLLGSPRPRYRGVEIVLSPGLKAAPELLVIAAVTSPWILGHFQRGAAGG